MASKDTDISQIHDLGVLFPSYPDTSSLLVGTTRAGYSASAIVRAVEDCGAHVLNLNITSLESEDWPVVVALRINRLNPDAVVRSLERYGFEVLDLTPPPVADDEELRQRAAHVLRLINL